QAGDLTAQGLQGAVTLPAMAGSASLREGRLAVTLTNPSVDGSMSARIRLAGGGTVREGRGRGLTHDAMNAANTLDRPNEVAAAALSVAVSGGTASVSIPKQGIAALELLIG